MKNKENENQERSENKEPRMWRDSRFLDPQPQLPPIFGL
jgi:hypothetical protein